jgi:hypothetical protein
MHQKCYTLQTFPVLLCGETGFSLKVLNFEAYKISALSVADFYKLSDSSTSIQEFLPSRLITNASRRTLLHGDN